MLVLTRKKFDKVILTLPDGSVIEVSIVDIDRNKVKVGFEADRSIVIVREELLRRDTNASHQD